MGNKQFVKMFYLNSEDVIKFDAIYNKVLELLKDAYPNNQVVLAEMCDVGGISICNDARVGVDILAKYSTIMKCKEGNNKSTCIPYYDLPKEMEEVWSSLVAKQKKIKKLKQSMNVYDYRNAVRFRKSATITCKDCGHTQKVIDVKNNLCVMCAKDLRSVTVKNTLDTYVKKIDVLLSEKKELEQKIKNNSKKHWVVRAEYQVY